jgi:hypothetical protein
MDGPPDSKRKKKDSGCDSEPFMNEKQITGTIADYIRKKIDNHRIPIHIIIQYCPGLPTHVPRV